MKVYSTHTGDPNLDPFGLSLLKSANVERTHVNPPISTSDSVFAGFVDSKNCGRLLHSWFCAFLSNHLCWHLSCSNNPSSSVRACHSSNNQLNPCSCPCHCSCPVLAVLAVLAVHVSLCRCPCRACLPLPLPNAPVSIGSSPPGCDGPFGFVFRACAWRLDTRSMF